MTINKGKITKINELRQNGYSIRKIAKRLGISKDTVWKYCRSPFSIPENQLSGYQKDIKESIDRQEELEETLQRQEKPFISTKVAEWYTSEPPHIHNTENDYFYTRENRKSRIRGIPLDQPNNELEYYYPRETDYYDPYFNVTLMMQRDKNNHKEYRPLPPWKYKIPVSQMNHREPKIEVSQKSQLQILLKQRRGQEVKRLTKRLDKFIESEREDEHYLKAESQQLQLDPQEKKEIEKFQHTNESTKKQLDIEQERPMQLIKGHNNNEMQTLNSHEEIHSNKTNKKDKLLDKSFAIEIGTSILTEIFKISEKITAQKDINNRKEGHTHVRLLPIKYKKVKLKLAKDNKE